MFNTSITLLRDIKAYCELNIEAGSIHFHALEEVLEEGIRRHLDYLGSSVVDSLLPPTTATVRHVLPKADAKNQAAIAAVIAGAPSTLPVPADYTTNLEYLQAKLAYRAARAAAVTRGDTND